jgi:hypothetical protein
LEYPSKTGAGSFGGENIFFGIGRTEQSLDQNGSLRSVNYRNRKRLKDALSRRYRSLWREKKSKVKLKNDLLQRWIGCHPDAKGSIHHFFDISPIRHGIAHGRYYSFRTKIQVPQVIKERVDALINAGIMAI